ncbi:MAG: hypothetical protein R3C68_01240 [Myxococcota bacterium]
MALVMFAGPAGAAGDVVEAWGEAQVIQGNQAAAKKAATDDALRRCVEQIVGVSIRSEFTSQMQETVRNNQNVFDAQVQDILVKHSSGFVESYDVVEERLEAAVVKIKVRARVYESKITAEVKKLTELIAQAGYPKIMLAVQDVYVTGGKRRGRDSSQLGAALEERLLARGFELKGQKVAASLITQSPTTWQEHTQDIASRALNAGADIVIYGILEIADKGVITETPFDALKGQTRVELTSHLRGLVAATGMW